MRLQEKHTSPSGSPIALVVSHRVDKMSKEFFLKEK